MKTASVSIDAGHFTHPLCKTMKRGWEESSGEVLVLITPQLMNILVTWIAHSIHAGLHAFHRSSVGNGLAVGKRVSHGSPPIFALNIAR